MTRRPHLSRSHILIGAGVLALAALLLIGYLILSPRAGVNPLAEARLYRSPDTTPVRQYEALKQSDPAQAAEINKIASYPLAVWFTSSAADIKASSGKLVSAAALDGAVPILVAYNIPARDCGSFSGGGSGGHAEYRTWIDRLAAGIGQRRAVVVLEPDALQLTDCLDGGARAARFASLAYAVDTLKGSTGALVYIDAGNASWRSPAETASRLKEAGIARADGFALNVANFQTTDSSVRYGGQISRLTGGKHFVVDTSRNGLGPHPSNGFCNPPGRALGQTPTTDTGSGLVDAYLWIKTPGESDGTCNGGPSAGAWWPEYALGLARRSSVTAGD